jgi:hypothetical protein
MQQKPKTWSRKPCCRRFTRPTGSGANQPFTPGTVGYLHLSFYPVPIGDAFGEVYFGQGKWVQRSKRTSHRESEAQPAHRTAAAVEDRILVTGANRVMLEYLGNPVEPPAAMESAYTKEGLTQAIRQAARKARVSVGRIEIDNSEYPYLIGVVCEEDDYNDCAQAGRAERVRLARETEPRPCLQHIC